MAHMKLQTIARRYDLQSFSEMGFYEIRALGEVWEEWCGNASPSYNEGQFTSLTDAKGHVRFMKAEMRRNNAGDPEDDGLSYEEYKARVEMEALLGEDVGRVARLLLAYSVGQQLASLQE